MNDMSARAQVHPSRPLHVRRRGQALPLRLGEDAQLGPTAVGVGLSVSTTQLPLHSETAQGAENDS